MAVGLAMALGIAAGVSLSGARPQPTRVEVARVVEARVDPVQLEGVQAIRDEAEALTAANVALDERAHELWMPRVAKIELVLADPQTPAPIRDELDATLSALERVGVLRP